MSNEVLEFTKNTQSKEESESFKFDIPYGYKATITLEPEKFMINSENDTTISVEQKKIANNSESGTIYINNNIQKSDSTNIDDLLSGNNRLNSYIFNTINKVKEEESMKVERIKKINKLQIKFLSVSFTTILLSLTGFIVFLVSEFYIVNPLFYIVTLFMGIGWGATAIASIMRNKND